MVAGLVREKGREKAAQKEKSKKGWLKKKVVLNMLQRISPAGLLLLTFSTTRNCYKMSVHDKPMAMGTCKYAE